MKHPVRFSESDAPLPYIIGQSVEPEELVMPDDPIMQARLDDIFEASPLSNEIIPDDCELFVGYECALFFDDEQKRVAQVSLDGTVIEIPWESCVFDTGEDFESEFYGPDDIGLRAPCDGYWAA